MANLNFVRRKYRDDGHWPLAMERNDTPDDSWNGWKNYKTSKKWKTHL